MTSLTRTHSKRFRTGESQNFIVYFFSNLGIVKTKLLCSFLSVMKFFCSGILRCKGNPFLDSLFNPYYLFLLFFQLHFVIRNAEFLFYRATQIKTYSWDNAQVILVGNKCDLEDDRLVPTEDGQRLAEELGKTNSLLFVYLKLHFCPLYIIR